MDAAVKENENKWEELDKAVWYPITPLGSKWLAKWTSSANGYSIIITDGVNFWGEQRTTSYVEEKAQEWAACIESGVEELLKLILCNLKENVATLRLSYEDLQNKLIIELEASLELLPFSWLFYLSKLSHHLVEHHWTLPLVTSMEMMSTKIFKLEEELKKKQRQLEDLLPPQPVPRRDNEHLLNLSMDIAVQKVINDGIGKSLCSNLGHSAILQTKLANKRIANQNHNSSLLQQDKPHNRPKLKKKGAFGVEENVENERFKAEEVERRSQVQAIISQAPATPTKKKKKLNI